MRLFLDTSVFAAALIDSHPHHVAARPWVNAVLQRQHIGVIAAHSLAEIYAYLTRDQLAHRIPPKRAVRLIEHNILAACEVIMLTSEEYVEALAAVSDLGLAGAIVYDMLLLRAAHKANVEFVVTFNKKHFALLNSGRPELIVSPLDRGPDTF
jgi:predicted nucleic acid-binding protein